MNWQEPSVFILVAVAAAYLARVFVQQFGDAQSSRQPACAKCSGCNTAAEMPQVQPLVQISRSQHD